MKERLRIFTDLLYTALNDCAWKMPRVSIENQSRIVAYFELKKRQRLACSKSLRAEIDETLIEAYKGTTSLPFELDKNNRIAVKIVDDRGIESLKVIDVTPEKEK